MITYDASIHQKLLQPTKSLGGGVTSFVCHFNSIACLRAFNQLDLSVDVTYMEDHVVLKFISLAMINSKSLFFNLAFDPSSEDDGSRNEEFSVLSSFVLVAKSKM